MSNGLTSLLTDRKISTRIGLGFACVLAVLLVVSGITWYAFRSSAAGVANYAARVAVVGAARDIDRSFVNLRRFVREYALSGVEINVDAAKQEQTILRDRLRQGLDITRNPERRHALEDISRAVDSYFAEFDKVVASTRRLTDLERSGLDGVGGVQQRTFDALRDAVKIAAGPDPTGPNSSGNAPGDAGVAANEHPAAAAGDVAGLAARGFDQLMVARLDVNKFLGRHDLAAATGAETTFAALGTTLQALDGATKDAAYRKTV
ncbi:MAG TPA: hypothetical protein VHX39_28060, partial [Acetobacteraceae bacterium]|nr:hypothetical protein [Acetobacteraceae bacterium]